MREATSPYPLCRHCVFPFRILKYALEVANVFAGLFMVTVIGVLIESLVFRNIERLTVRRWGMQT